METLEAPVEQLSERQITLDLLKALHSIWHDIRERRRRTAPITEYFVPSGDHQVESEWVEINKDVDAQLKQLGVTDGIPC